MCPKCSLIISPLNVDMVKQNSCILPREFLNLFEYKIFSTDQLRLNTISVLNSCLSNENNFSISVLEDKKLKGYIIIEFMPYDSHIFEFNVYKISDFCFLGKNDSENSQIIQIILDELKNKIDYLGIKYLIISINANISIASLFLNLLIKNSFYFINTLITFKMEKGDYGRVKLSEPKDNKVKVREIGKEDIGEIIEIAKNSYKIDRFHLDPNLDKNKCNLLYEQSAINSISNGYADIVFVAEYNNKIVGYFSAKKHVNQVLGINFGIGLVSAVSENVRNMGVFSLMNNHILEWCYYNTDITELGTYITNIPVHRTFIYNRLNIIRGTYQLAFYNNR